MHSIEWWHCRWSLVTPKRTPTTPICTFCTAIHSFATGEPRDFKFGTLIYHCKSHLADEKSSLKGALSGSREQFLRCGLRKFRYSKSSVYRWYTQLVRGRFVYDTYETMRATPSRRGWVHTFITHCLQVNLQFHTIDLVRTCRISRPSFCTVAWLSARFQLTRRITRSLGDSWAFCYILGKLRYALVMVHASIGSETHCLLFVMVYKLSDEL